MCQATKNECPSERERESALGMILDEKQASCVEEKEATQTGWTSLR
jgi:hypothetical protein